MRPAPPRTPDVSDPYDVLGLSPAASQQEIKDAYFVQVRAHPPERDPAAFKRIRAAYDRLNTPEKKLETDMLRAQSWPEPVLAPPPHVTMTVDPADVIRVARALSDLARNDWREDWREVKL